MDAGQGFTVIEVELGTGPVLMGRGESEAVSVLETRKHVRSITWALEMSAKKVWSWVNHDWVLHEYLGPWMDGG